LALIAPVDSKVEKGTEVGLDACLERYFADHEIDGVNCPVCAKATTYTQRYRFIRYPKCLCIVLQRFVYDDWVPKKLEIELQVPLKADEVLDLESKYTSKTNCKLAEGEEGFPEDLNADQEVEPELNQELLNMVLQMGIPENPAKHALYNTGNSDADAAVTWYFENMANESIN
jgi:ubiquitin carboxyl-terminal hydrolase 5/13